MNNISMSPKPNHATEVSRAVVIVRTERLSFDQLKRLISVLASEPTSNTVLIPASKF